MVQPVNFSSFSESMNTKGGKLHWALLSRSVSIIFAKLPISSLCQCKVRLHSMTKGHLGQLRKQKVLKVFTATVFLLLSFLGSLTWQFLRLFAKKSEQRTMFSRLAVDISTFPSNLLLCKTFCKFVNMSKDSIFRPKCIYRIVEQAGIMHQFSISFYSIQCSSCYDETKIANCDKLTFIDLFQINYEHPITIIFQGRSTASVWKIKLSYRGSKSLV